MLSLAACLPRAHALPACAQSYKKQIGERDARIEELKIDKEKLHASYKLEQRLLVRCARPRARSRMLSRAWAPARDGDCGPAPPGRGSAWYELGSKLARKSSEVLAGAPPVPSYLARQRGTAAARKGDY